MSPELAFTHDGSRIVEHDGDIFPLADDPDAYELSRPPVPQEDIDEMRILDAMPQPVRELVLEFEARRRALEMAHSSGIPERLLVKLDTAFTTRLTHLAAAGVDISLALPAQPSQEPSGEPSGKDVDDGPNDSPAIRAFLGSHRDRDWAERQAGDRRDIG